VLDGSPPEEESPGSWREQEQVDEQYREPDPESGDVGPSIPAPPDPSENDVDPGLARRFWALVLVFNAALLALSLGAMLAVFEGNYSLGGQLLLGGAAAFGFGLYRYRTAKTYLAERSGDGDTHSETGEEQD
jgi:hypothetical protein